MSVVSTVPMSALQGFVEQQNNFAPDQMTNQRLNRLLGLFGYASTFKQHFHKRWKKNYEYYMSWDAEIKNRKDYQSKIFVPRPFLVVETKTPKLVQAIISKDPIWTVKPQSRDDEMKAKVCSELMTWQFRNHPNITLELVLTFKDSFIYGGAVGKTGWQFKQEDIPMRQQVGPMVDPISMQLIFQDQVTTQRVTTIDRPFYKNVDIGEIFPDPMASSIEDCKFIIHQQMVPWMDLMAYQQMGVYQNVDKITRTNSIGPSYDDFANRRFSIGALSSPSMGNNTPTTPLYDLVEVLECWWYDESGRKMKTVIANKQVIIQDIPLPYWHQNWPFYLFKDVPMTKEFWGMGEIDPIADLCKELNDLRNQQSDNRNQFLKAFWVVDRNANIDMDMLENMPPGGILDVTGDPNAALTILRPPQLDTMTLGGQQQIDSDIQMTSGANDMAIGQPTRSQTRNATTASILAQSTDTRYGLTAITYLEQLRRVGSDWLKLSQQFMSQPVMVRVMGQDGLTELDYAASPYDVPQQFDLYVSCGAEFQGDKELQKQQMLQLFGLLGQIPGFNATEYAKEMMQEFGFKNPERYFEGQFIVPTEQIMQMMGINDSSIQSKYLEMEGGMRGGGTQGPGISQAAGRPDLLQMPGVNGSAMNAGRPAA